MAKIKQHISDAREKLFAGIGVPERAELVPDEFQLEAIESLKGDVDTLVVAPTGAGKTYIAVEAIKQVMAEGKRAIYTAPLKALSNAKYAEFKRSFEPQNTVGLLTGDRKIEGDADVVVATTEIYRNELFSGRAPYSLVVLDEFHYLADAQRGAVWEESVILSPKSATLLMLSASISNPVEVAQWIEEIRNRPVRIVSLSERPVALRLGFLHPSLGVIPMLNRKGEVFQEVARFYSGGGKRKGFSGRRGSGRDGRGGRWKRG